MADSEHAPEQMPPPSPGTGGDIDFYFDFISPFGYFASLRIDALAARYGRRTRWHSMLIGVSVVKVMGLKPLLETPLKGPYTERDALRYARRHGIALGREIMAPMADPRPAGRAYSFFAVHHPGRARQLAQRLFAAYWLRGADISRQETIDAVLADLGMDRPDVRAGVAGEEAGEQLRQSVAASLERGVFGSPFFIVDGEPFFGVDKMELLEDWLASGGW